MHSLARKALAVALMTSFAMAAHAGPFNYTPDAAGEKAFLKAFHVEEASKVSYEDTEGKSVSFAEFLDAINASHSVGSFKNTKDGSVVMKAMKPRTPEEMKADLAKWDAAHKVRPGEALPDFKLTALDGTAYDKARLNGRYTVLSFFFAACAPCIAEVPSLNKFKELHPELNVAALTFDDRKTAQRFQDKYKLSWPTLIETKPFNETLGINSFPSMVLLDPQGRVLGYKQFGKTPTEDESAGRAENAELAAWVRELVAKSGSKGG